ncbi:hypothetical protein PF005_g3559 [Phytophthora fragariae]|uniref:Myb/SANT-like domain-containing protein n=1 Tax=Phytophthora fragariae TaxID=53985 RepID=A0A6A3UQT2_9STRA|nr:hypothetical protein PF009_g2212 [Phytophthora fragariae]KAE9026159.1 hypothetical protein PF011_g2696 [Phytophthora fragariae]KAE9132486.1 hypothetical protein PF010_g3151 [Phytophthora fragariae]KAE9137373.1 hypothetical protein PF007_g1820 [Phytophthora fragariae]KAE9153016.1 hypothetical protein PF006_g2813 [Phytophthora fragariae]
MSNVTSWTEAEIDILIQTWSEVEAKYPMLRCPRGSGTLHAKLYALFSKRCKFTRSSSAVNRMKFHLRSFALFVKKFNEERLKDGGRMWFELSADEREQHRPTLPPNIRGLTSSVSGKTFATLLMMERAQRWLGSTPTDVEQLDDAKDARSDNSSLLSLPPSPHPEPPISVAKEEDDEEGFSSPFESTSPSTEQHAKDEENTFFDSSSSSPMSIFDEDSWSKYTICKTLSSEEKEEEPQRQSKHRECNALLEKMIKLQNNKMRRAVNKLRAGIEGEILRNAGMLRSISSNQSGGDAEAIGDAAFVSKVLDMQLQQVQDRFDQFEEKQTSEEVVKRALLQ